MATFERLRIIPGRWWSRKLYPYISKLLSRIFRQKRLGPKPKKLFLGCGPLPVHPYHLKYLGNFSEWTLIDLYVDDPRVVKMDARKLDYLSNSIGQIYTSHLLEHLPYQDIGKTLKEWRRVLKPGSKLQLNVPDLEWASEQLVRYEQDPNDHDPRGKYYANVEDLIKVFYGHQHHEGDYHRTGFTKNSLKQALKKAGFSNIIVHQEWEAHDMQCLIATANKPK